MKMSIGQLFRKLLPERKNKIEVDTWPFLRGRYFVVDATAPVVVVTLDDEPLAAELAALAPPGLCMSCSIRDDASDVSKLAKTLITNLSIQYLIVVGRTELMRDCLRTLFVGDADETADTLGRNKLSAASVATLRKQVQLEELLDCSDLDKIILRIRNNATSGVRPDTGFVALAEGEEEHGPTVIAADNLTHEVLPDKAGSFLISLVPNRIQVRHLDSKEQILRTIEGTSARSICLTLIRNGWVSRLDHAAYLGRTLQEAERALKDGSEFHQLPDEPGTSNAPAAS